MLYLAKEYENSRYVTLNEISQSENISLKYLEKIMLSLNKKDFFKSSRGTHGGYKLKYSPECYTLKDILSSFDKELEITSCVTEVCPKKNSCITFPVWNDLNDTIDKFLENKTLKDYIEVIE